MSRIAINKCQHGAWAVSVERNGSGTRLVGKCCRGPWNEVHSWPVTPDQLREIVIELECEADIGESAGG